MAELKEGSGSLQVISTQVFSEMPQTNYLTAAGVHQYVVALMAADLSWIRWTPKIRWCLSMWC